MMKLEWLEKARHDMQSLRRYIAEDNPIAAEYVVARILDVTNLLLEQPAIGRPGRLHNTRELIISSTPYIVLYRVKNNIIEILRIYHSARQWPGDLN